MKRRFGNKQPSKQALRTALGALVVMRESLDGIDHASLARSYGVTAQDVTDMVAAERMRRLRL